MNLPATIASSSLPEACVDAHFCVFVFGLHVGKVVDSTNTITNDPQHAGNCADINRRHCWCFVGIREILVAQLKVEEDKTVVITFEEVEDLSVEETSG